MWHHSHNPVSMVVADALAPTWRQGISKHYAMPTADVALVDIKCSHGP